MVSCIVTTYKRPVEIVKRAIESIISQTYKDIEIIVVNDAPEMHDLTIEIEKMINNYGVQKKYIVHEKNMGACAARNTGIDVADGEYVAFLDDDDEWLPDKLEKQIELMKKTGAALVYCPYYNIDSKGNMNLIVNDFFKGEIFDNDFERLLAYNYVGSTSFPLLKKEVFYTIGKFNEKLKSSQDHDLWIRIAQKYKIAYYDEPLVKYYYSQEAISRSMEKKLQGYNYLMEEYSVYYANNKKLLNYRLNFIAYAFLKSHSLYYFCYYWLKALHEVPFSKNNFFVVRQLCIKIKRIMKLRITV